VEGKIKPVIAKIFSLESAVAAMRYQIEERSFDR
jgi:hypothetical protein